MFVIPHPEGKDGRSCTQLMTGGCAHRARYRLFSEFRSDCRQPFINHFGDRVYRLLIE